MTAVLTIAVLVFVGIAAWQMNKIFELSQVRAKSETSEIANDEDNHSNGWLMFGFVIFLYVPLLFACSMANTSRFGFRNMEWNRFFVVVVLCYYFYSCLSHSRYCIISPLNTAARRKKGLLFADNDRLEFIWTIIPVIVLAGLLYRDCLPGPTLWISMRTTIHWLWNSTPSSLTGGPVMEELIMPLEKPM